jgi:methylphosphotriester-DNA--protein-cysteine methyltransferase
MELDHEACYRALSTRDVRFDGRFFIAVRASPIAVAQTRRVLFAKQLIMETTMPMAEVALAAGFNSIRRFNAMFQTLYQRPPRELRRPQLADAEQGQCRCPPP